MTLPGHVKNGTIVFDQPVVLPEGAAVRVEVINPAAATPAEQQAPTLYERLKPFVGSLPELPPDASANLDHYLYGTPKRQ
jgi:hypothetical protein